MSKTQHHLSKSLLSLAIAASSMAATAVEIEEVVVTAQKREQSLQDVPLAVSAFGQDFMERAGVEDVRDLVALSPGFSGATEDSFSDAMAMRGISTNDFGIGGDPSVAVFVDGVWAGRTGGVQSSFFDMAGAEVVKGPQGTLFGRNAIAGAVSIKTQKPTDEFEGNVKLGIAEYNRREVTGTINIPLSESWSMRASIYDLSEDGYLENIQGGDDFGFHERSAGRVALRYQGESIDATITAQYEDREQNSSIYWDEALGLPRDKVSQDLKGKDAIDEGEIANITANIEFDLNDSMSLTSVTGWKTYNFNYVEDYDARPELIDNFFLDLNVDYFSQELRLNFEASDTLVGFVGTSYYSESIDGHTGTVANENDLCNAIGRTDSPDFDGPVVNGCADINFLTYWLGETPTAADITEARDSALSSKNEDIFNKVEADGWAVFADLTWTPIDNLDIMYGVRYTEDSKEMGIKVLDSGGYLGNNFNFEYSIPEFVYDKTTWSDTTQRIAANYQLSDEVSIYANYSQGYKSGGYSTYGAILVDADEDGVADAGTKPESFAPETVDSFELGIKTKLLENTLQANLSLYSYTYEDLQLSYFDNGATKVENLGEADGTGFELDVRYLPTENLDLFFTAAYQDTTISDDAGVVGTACNEACSGNQLPFSPKVSTSAVATYSFPMENGEAYVTVEHFYQGKQYSDLDNNNYIAQQSHHETNMRIGYDSSEQWSATLWVENIFSEEYFERGWANGDLNNQYGYGITNTQVWPSKPRTIGVNFSYDF